MRLQEGRDKQILHYVSLFGFLTSLQLSTLHKTNIKVMQRRLRKMVFDEYLKKIPLPTTTMGACPYIYFLGSRSEQLLKIKSGRPRLNASLSHMIRNVDLMIQAMLSAEQEGLTCEILPEHIMRSENLNLIPDGAFTLSRNGKKALFMLESDGGTMVLKSDSMYSDIENKFLKYIEMFSGNSVGYYSKCFSYEFNRFRLLYICEDKARLKNILQMAENMGMNFIFITTQSLFMAQGLNFPIWDSPSFGKDRKKLIE